MATSLVLRLPRTDAPGDFILVNVQQSGPLPLDLKLVATDGNAPFVAHTQQRRVHELQTSSSQTSSDEWNQVLSVVLLQHAANQPVLGDLEAVANILDSELILVIRKKISGITQRLGAIHLRLDEEEDIQLFDWTSYAVSRADCLADQLARLQTSVTDQQSKITDLISQLDDLVKAKKSHEEELLKKFAAVLNAKKLKIRDQQRLLAHAKIDPKTTTEVQRARSAAARKPGSSRSGKRKANDVVPESETDDDFDGRIEGEDDIRQENGDLVTPEKSDVDETEDEDTDGSGFAPAPPQSQASRHDVRPKDKAPNPDAPEKTTSLSEEVGTRPSVAIPPPRRELPFAKTTHQAFGHAEATSKSSAAFKQPTPVVDEDDETDDEL